MYAILMASLSLLVLAIIYWSVMSEYRARMEEAPEEKFSKEKSFDDRGKSRLYSPFGKEGPGPRHPTILGQALGKKFEPADMEGVPAAPRPTSRKEKVGPAPRRASPFKPNSPYK